VCEVVCEDEGVHVLLLLNTFKNMECKLIFQLLTAKIVHFLKKENFELDVECSHCCMPFLFTTVDSQHNTSLNLNKNNTKV